MADNRQGPFRVRVYENSHYQDEDEAYDVGLFATAEEALQKCREIVDRSLEEAVEPGCTAEGIYAHYIMYGDDPVPFGLDFSGWHYAKVRAADLASSEESGT